MTRKILSKALTALAAAFLAVGLSGPASAAELTATLDFSFGNGSCGGGGTTCSVAVHIDDQNTVGSVVMTVDASGLPSGTSLAELYFNTDPYASLSPVLLVYVVGTVGSTNLNTSFNGFTADGDGSFDHLISPPGPGPGSDRFDAGEIFAFHMSAAGLTANHFNSQSVNGVPGAGNYCIAALIQNTGVDTDGDGVGDNSDWLGAATCEPKDVAEPSSLLLFGTGLLVLGAVTRRRRKIA